MRDSGSLVANPGWYKALTLKERLLLLRGHPTGGKPEIQDKTLAGKKLQAWRTQAPFDKDVSFEERLSADGLTEEELLILIGESAESGWARLSAPPAWLQELARIFEHPSEPSALAEIVRFLKASADPHLGLPPYSASLQGAQSVLPVFYPLLARAVARLREGLRERLEKTSIEAFDPEPAALLFLPGLVAAINQQVIRTLTLELNVARLEERLVGETAEDRFLDFIEQLGQKDRLFALLTEYVCLSRIIIETMERWVDSSLECLQHLYTNWDDICGLLTPDDDPGPLSRVISGIGDSHSGGRSTLILEFTSGFRVVYKPRPLAVEIHFQELLSWLNERGARPAFRVLRMLDYGSHGWSEYVQQGGCDTQEQVARFYERLGGYLALLYLLEATDVHHENLIAAGEYPVVVDLETLFHPSPHQQNQHIWDADNDSVLRVRLLPYRIFVTPEQTGLEISGLGGEGGQLTPIPVLRVRERSTDHMHFVREHVKIAEAKNRPKLGEQQIDILDYAQEFLRGFHNTWRLCDQYKEALIGGPIQAFAGDAIRVILRGTWVYAQLLNESYHPDLLRDALERDCFFDHLWTASVQRPCLKRSFTLERDDLHRGDIPLFRTGPSTRDISCCDGRVLVDFLSRPSFEIVEQRLRGLNEEGLSKQVWFIEASFATIALGEEPYLQKLRPSPEIFHMAPTEEAASPDDRLIKAAQLVGERLNELALKSGSGSTWLGVRFLTSTAEWTIRPAGLDLYNGAAGICLFLAYLAEVTRMSHYRSLARSALQCVSQQMAEGFAQAEGPGGFQGWAGVMYAYAHLGVLWQDEEILREATEYARLVPFWIDRDSYLDIIAGAAGAIPCLLALHQAMPNDEVLGIALRCGEWLIERAPQCQSSSANRVREGNGARPRVGFAHGAAGMALSLMRLFAVTQQPRLRDAALAAIEYERSVFSPEEQNWPVIVDGQPDWYRVNWCQGAPGIGLSRLAMLPYIDDGAIRSEIAIAVRTTLRHGFGRNHSLCHGDLGNLETIHAAARLLGDASYQKEFERLSARILHDIEANGWQTGAPRRVETPGLMVGIAGIGYGLLKLAFPERLPSVLTLAPPSSACPGKVGTGFPTRTCAE